MPDEQVRLELERARTEEFLKRVEDTYMPLAVAAAIVFHQAHGSTKAIVTRGDYDDALNIAAAALSRLIPIYTLRDPREGRTPITTDLVRQRFARGATELRSQDGSVTGPLWVTRSDLLSAASLIKRTGLPFSFALSPESNVAEPVEKLSPERK